MHITPDLKEIYYQSVEGSSIERGIFAIKNKWQRETNSSSNKWNKWCKL